MTRCGATYALDGFKAGVSFDIATDRYCLNGLRLVAVQGNYGADGTVYHTEKETWTRIVSHGICGQGPCSFSAQNKDGHILLFGSTVATGGSRILAHGRTDGSVRVWGIDRITDLNGNYTRVRYINDSTTGEYYPEEILYTGNEGAQLSPQRSVKFDFQARSDISARYLAGSQVPQTKLLKSIKTYVGTNPALHYELHYANSAATGYSLLERLTLCDAARVCFPDTEFTWQKTKTGFRPPSTKLPGPLYVIMNNKGYVQGSLQDINGDGIADYSIATEFVSSTGINNELKVFLGQPDGSFVPAGF